jgi:hypothetical protein
MQDLDGRTGAAVRDLTTPATTSAFAGDSVAARGVVGGIDFARFEAAGFAVVRQALSPARLADLREEWAAFQPTSLAARPNLLPRDQPAAVFWRHVPGERKRIRPISEFPVLGAIAHDSGLAEIVRGIFRHRGIAHPVLRLFEAIVFDKPARLGTPLSWHQDISFFPFEPNNQIALWIPLDRVDGENGTLRYAVASHKLGPVGSADLQTGASFPGDARPRIPPDPAAAGFEVVPVLLDPGDVAVHDGSTWHGSTPNLSDRPRRSLSIRYLIGETRYAPTPGSAATFVQQVNVRPGELIDGPMFPLLPDIDPAAR